MAMKNKFFRRAHISEAKFKLILKLFCDEKTAVEISEVTGISRVTVNKYLGDIRQMIMTCDDDLLKQDARMLFSETFSSNEKKADKAKGQLVTMAGIELEGGTLKVHPIEEVAHKRMIQIAEGKKRSKKEEEMAQKFCGFVDLKGRQYYKLRTVVRKRNASQIAKNADRFWQIFRTRIHKSKGLASNTIYLHLKESELRYNYRKAEMYTMLLKVLRRRNVRIDRAA
jgi:transposase